MENTTRRQRRATRSGGPSMAGVARAAGVSAQTVSRVLAGHPSVRPETREAVLAAVADSGYRVNRAAASLSSGRTRLLGVVTLQTPNYSLGGLLGGVEAAASELGYFVTSAIARSLDREDVADALDRVIAQGAEAVVMAVPAPLATDLAGHGVPMITIDRDEATTMPAVTVDQRGIGRAATEHLLSLGHRTVWHVRGPEGWAESRLREAGWREALAAAGVAAPAVLSGDWSPESGYRAGREIAERPDATAVFVASDEMAFGVLRALHEAGRDVPDDVSVVGVDDIPLAEFASPALTTVRQPFGRIGALAVRMLVERLDGAGASGAELLDPELVVRGSSAPPRAGARD